MPLQDDLFAIEERFWTSGPEYYATHLAPAAMMVFPEPTGVLVRDEIASSVQGARWSEVSLEEHRLLELDENSALVTYKATALRGNEPPYVARASSAYVRGRDGGWKLAFHQQTPVNPAEESRA
jgi:hypothetical protein